jgi:hypothetical protein
LFEGFSWLDVLYCRCFPVCVEGERVDLDAESCDVLLLELSGQMALHEGRLPGAAVTHQDQLEGRNIVRVVHCAVSFAVV